MAGPGRRAFLGGVAALATAGFGTAPAEARFDARLVGLQLSSVEDALTQDFTGTMRAVAEIGYRQVEAVRSIAGLTIGQVAEAARGLGLRCSSAHVTVPDLQPDAAGAFGRAREAGLDYLVCVTAWARDPSRIKPLAPSDPLVKLLGAETAFFANVMMNLSLDDYRWTADFLNEAGETARKAGVSLGYHNEIFEFAAKEGVVPYDLLLERTDPDRVFFQLDCGNMASAGFDPAAYLTRHPQRFRLLHVKDLARDQPIGGFRATELGNGTLDLNKILRAAQQAPITGYFVEQGASFDQGGRQYQRPSLESARISFDYLKKLLAA